MQSLAESPPTLEKGNEAERDLDGLVAQPLCGQQRGLDEFRFQDRSSQSGQMRANAKFSFTGPGSATLVDSSMSDLRHDIQIAKYRLRIRLHFFPGTGLEYHPR